MDAPRPQAPQVTVRWESATPVLEAYVKSENPNAAKIKEWSKEFYVISTHMPPRSGGDRAQKGGMLSDADLTRIKPMLERMQQATVLRRKGGEPISPARVELLPEPTGMHSMFLFPRSLGADDKEVTFETSLGRMKIKSKFQVKDMQYEGKPAL